MAKAPNIERSSDTKTIIVPEKMKLSDAAKWLQRQDEAENEVITYHEVIEGHPLDAAIAVYRGLQEVYGFVDLRATPGFFGSTPPRMITVPVGPKAGETVSLPWGRMYLPGMDGGYLQTFLGKGPSGRPVLILNGSIRRRNEGEALQVAIKARELLSRESIFRGKALRISFGNDEAESPDEMLPQFMDVSHIRTDELVFSAETETQIRTNLFAPILHSDQCRRAGVPLKRGVLLAGPYGVGKTLTAYVTAKHCVDHGWTFLYLESVSELDQAIDMALPLGPTVIFAEDLDQAVSSERNERINRILNSIDGITSKGSDLMVVLTTNHVEAIGQAMLRPGRLDAIIAVTPPDADAAIALVRQYGRGLVTNGDLGAVGEALAGQIPAVIRETVERSKLAAISRDPSGSIQIEASDLLVASESMQLQLELLRPVASDARSDRERAAAILADALRPSNGGATKGAPFGLPVSARG